MNPSFKRGLRNGIPIALGYLSVAFGFGIMATRAGLTVTQAVILSASNMTSAGQVAGVSIIAAGGTYWEMALTQLVINLRYALMSLSLSQKLDSSFHTPQRMIASFGITDEIFALSSMEMNPVKPWYMYGLILISCFGWSFGTFLGAAAGSLLPQVLSDAMGIMLYGMFLAVVIPPARAHRSVMVAALLAAACSIVCYYFLSFLSSGFAVIITSVVAASVTALIYPLDDEKEEEAAA